MGVCMNANTAVVPAERRDPYSVTLKLKDGADATAQQRHPVVMDPGVRRDDWLRGSCLDLDTRFGPAARCARAFARNLCPREGVGNAGRTMHPRSRVHLVVVKAHE